MASYFGTGTANKIISLTLNGGTFTPITKGYLALYSSNPTGNNTGIELSGGSYARQEITIGTPSGGATSNSTRIIFMGLPAGSVTHWGILSAVTGGDLLYYGNLDVGYTLTTGDEIKLEIGALTIQLQIG